ncbi:MULTISPECIES: hypothetical protein [Methanobacterium]|uniref:Uncharacterized protein n=1 Tax=Methanobacterium bryantii TaxID=2161 RepID=A0A2A2H8Z9_METBR|nr:MULTISPECIES: hypothetical protein [Methanobacterium]OEC87883.1 hypothetical protein A9507_06825 [Methanobacterium sp. A39]PAV05750.1 hypothetical protein ASJ80_08435 [Methanobacterium bryantii]
MRISETTPSNIELTFTEEEEQNSLFQTALEKIRNLFDSVGEDGTVNVELIDARTLQIVGMKIDAIRQILCGDVDPTADLSECPRFVLGDVDPVPDEGEVI